VSHVKDLTTFYIWNFSLWIIFGLQFSVNENLLHIPTCVANIAFKVIRCMVQVAGINLLASLVFGVFGQEEWGRQR
jgi:hypothetical protein